MQNDKQPIQNFLLTHKKAIVLVNISVLGLMGWLFGWLDFIPKIDTPLGDFQLKNQKASVIEKDTSVFLPSSIYPILYELYYSNETSLERKNFFEKYKDFEVAETGEVVDIGTDSKTLVLKGNKDGKSAALVCNFKERWKKRIALFKKGDILNFKGIISDFSPSNLVSLTNCDVVE